jgi:hypothetical protein
MFNVQGIKVRKIEMGARSQESGVRSEELVISMKRTGSLPFRVYTFGGQSYAL